MRKVMAALMGSVIAYASIVGITTATAGTASADPCIGNWSIGIGGLTTSGGWIFGQDSSYLGVNQPVGYNSVDLNSGVNEVDRLVNQHRNDCPADHITLLGHSGGAIVAHVWVTQHGDYPNLNAILIADPKRPAGPGGQGFGGTPPMSWLPYPYSGTDNFFGSIPVLEICHPNDHICNSDSDWGGYFAGAHNAYDMNAWDYPTDAAGLVYE